ncbi:MAG TPA: response regulator [Polyangiaceae bacterium]|jgi:DNA-binding NtrC family response regulator|nr:MAG: Transcriptional regulatory protein ZraR [Deltaproteobacteria bacterium ADurb.Bin207]HNS98437.1 response regulator [Polyangiaceae bacterium]HNZ22747.1 response regulator [Polyangiaceae bacterium]HOD25185.1 response regulator [Polyangiaceae bacterium]HOE47645.1 response regulator [Polyangiaceae bacterium]
MADNVQVLVLDDEPLVGKRLKSVLVKMRCDVEAFDDPMAALARIDEKEFDIVITDVVMGEVDGIQVLERVRGRNPRAKVIIMSAYAMMAMARKAMERGAYDFIAKPFVPEEMRVIVAKAARDLGFDFS